MDYTSKLLEALEMLAPGSLFPEFVADKAPPTIYACSPNPSFIELISAASSGLGGSLSLFGSPDALFEHLAWNSEALYRPSVSLIHLGADVPSALRLVRWLQQAHPDRFMSTLVFSPSFDPELQLCLRDAGVRTKATPRAALEAKRFLAESLHNAIELRRCSLEKIGSIHRLSGLTPKEMLVMLLMLRGMTSREIAAEHGTSSRTVEIHRGRVLEKLNLRNAVQLAMHLHGTFKA